MKGRVWNALSLSRRMISENYPATLFVRQQGIYIEMTWPLVKL